MGVMFMDDVNFQLTITDLKEILGFTRMDHICSVDIMKMLEIDIRYDIVGFNILLDTL